MTPISPTQDTVIARKYSAKSLEDKSANKLALQEELGWTLEVRRPVLCLPVTISDALGGQLLQEVLPGILSLPVELLILGKGTSSYGSLFGELTKQHGHRIAIIPTNEASRRKMYAASDMALFLCDPTGMEELDHCLQYGIVPISKSCAKLQNYNPNQERGNAFTFEKENVWHCFAAMVRALETFRFPYDWRNIQREAMKNA